VSRAAAELGSQSVSKASPALTMGRAAHLGVHVFER
jgi:hypothetical protein